MLLCIGFFSSLAAPGSQLRQDQWVVEHLGRKRNGYFVDVGAHDGVELSNSLVLERDFGWRGICVESNPTTFDALSRRRACACSNATVGDGTSEVEFCDAALPEYGGIVGLRPFVRAECANLRRVQTTALADVLDAHNAPHIIDYLSIDIEGAELLTLSAFPFDRYRFRLLTVEHNEPHEASGVVPAGYRRALRALLEGHGYEFVRGNEDVLGQGFGPIEDFYRWSGATGKRTTKSKSKRRAQSKAEL